MAKKKEAAAKSDEQVLVHGVDADKINKEAVDRAIEHYGIKVDPKKGLTGKVEALLERLKKEPTDALCDTCQTRSDARLEECPICGDAEEVSSHELPADPPDAPAEEPKTAITKKDSAAMAGDAESHVAEVVGPAQELDRAVAEIRSILRGTAAAAYLLASKLAEIAKTDMWKQRRSADGKVAYTNFEGFCRAELQFGSRYVNELLELHAKFTEKEVNEFGPTRLRLVLAAPPEKKEEVVERLKQGQSRRQIETEVLGRNKNKKPDGRKREHRAEKPAAEKGGPTQTITVAALEGRQTVKLYKRAASKTDELVPAKRIVDMPWGAIDLANDVKMIFRLSANPSGELRMVVEVLRNKAG